MPTIKLIKKVFSLARYDFFHHVARWLSITGILSIFLVIILTTLDIYTGVLQPSIWDVPSSMFRSWRFAISHVHGIVTAYFSLWFPNWSSQVLRYGLDSLQHLYTSYLTVVLLQNCLDLAFDSQMSGFALLTDRLHRWVVLRVGLTTWVGSLLYQHFNFYMFDLMWLNYLALALGGLGFLYWSQLWYLELMHELEYKKGYWQSQKDIWNFSHQYAFLVAILILQILTCVLVCAAVYGSAHAAIAALTKILMWPSTLLKLVNAAWTLPVHKILYISTMIGNFFYVWLYLTLFAWLLLVWAHVYRQLICPPVDNPSCESCNSCERQN